MATYEIQVWSISVKKAHQNSFFDDKMSTKPKIGFPTENYFQLNAELALNRLIIVRDTRLVRVGCDCSCKMCV